MSRTRKPDEQKRSVRVVLCLTPGEGQLVESLCGEWTPGVYMREAALAAIRQEMAMAGLRLYEISKESAAV